MLKSDGMFEKWSIILDAGFVYYSDFDIAELKIIGAVGDSRWVVNIPTDRIKDLVKIFPEIDWHDEFLHKVKGQYVRIVVDVDTIIALKHTVKEITYYTNLEDNNV
jgi:hypothetical protein